MNPAFLLLNDVRVQLPLTASDLRWPRTSSKNTDGHSRAKSPLVPPVARKAICALFSLRLFEPSFNHSAIRMTSFLPRSNSCHAPLSASVTVRPTVFSTGIYDLSVTKFNRLVDLNRLFHHPLLHPLVFATIVGLSVARIPAPTFAFCQDRHLVISYDPSRSSAPLLRGGS
jgi:hypothetical protein